MGSFIKKVASENKGLIGFIILMTVFRSSLADWNSVPTGSMKPTIIEGDRIVINKLAYDLNIPFSHISLVKLGEPKRGEIVIFNSKVSEKRLVKRVIGLPGDTVSMTNNRLTINGTELHYRQKTQNRNSLGQATSLDLAENLLGFEHTIRVNTHVSKASNFPPITVPNGQYLVLGDNRDNSVDSRYIGFVPRDEIIGRSRNVAMSFDYENYYRLRKERFFRRL